MTDSEQQHVSVRRKVQSDRPTTCEDQNLVRTERSVIHRSVSVSEEPRIDSPLIQGWTAQLTLIEERLERIASPHLWAMEPHSLIRGRFLDQIVRESEDRELGSIAALSNSFRALRIDSPEHSRESDNTSDGMGDDEEERAKIES